MSQTTSPGVPMTADSTDRIEQACEVMHDAYEAAAAGAGWETQAASRQPWADVPEANKATMRAAVAALLAHLRATGPARDEGLRALSDAATPGPWVQFGDHIRGGGHDLPYVVSGMGTRTAADAAFIAAAVNHLRAALAASPAPGGDEATNLSGTFPDSTEEGEQRDGQAVRGVHGDRAESGPGGEPGRERQDQAGGDREDGGGVRRPPQRPAVVEAGAGGDSVARPAPGGDTARGEALQTAPSTPPTQPDRDTASDHSVRRGPDHRLREGRDVMPDIGTEPRESWFGQKPETVQPTDMPAQPDRDALARAIHGRGDSTDLMPDWAYDAADRVLALLAAGTPPDTAPREDGLTALARVAEWFDWNEDDGAAAFMEFVHGGDLGDEDENNAAWRAGYEWARAANLLPTLTPPARPVPPGPAATRDGEAGE